jgi:hypothetical protein
MAGGYAGKPVLSILEVDNRAVSRYIPRSARSFNLHQETGMIDPTDAISTRFDQLNGIAAQRGWSPSSHAHPTRYGEVLRIEKLEAPRRGVIRTSAIRAAVRLNPEPGKDRYAFIHIAGCFQTGRYAIAYYDERGSMIEASTGDVAFHRQYIERRDIRQALGTGFDLAVLGCLVRVLRDGGHSGAGEELADMCSVKRGEGPEGFRADVWPKLHALLDAAPLVEDVKTFVPPVSGRWVAVAKMDGGWRADIFRFADVSETGPEERFFRADPMAEGLMIAPDAGGMEPGFPRLDDMPLGADVSSFEPAKVIEVPDDLVAELRGFVPPWFPESFTLDL